MITLERTHGERSALKWRSFLRRRKARNAPGPLEVNAVGRSSAFGETGEVTKRVEREASDVVAVTLSLIKWK